MNLSFHNLGRLKSATLALDKRLTVFVGKNNTSKTYAAHAIYGCLKMVGPVLRDVLGKILPETGLAATIPKLEIDVVAQLDNSIGAIATRFSDEFSTRLPDMFATDNRFFSDARLEVSFDDRQWVAAKDRLLRNGAFTNVSYNGILAGLQKKPGASTAIINASVFGGPNGGEAGSPQNVGQLLAAYLIAGLLSETLFDGTPDNAVVLTAERSAIQLFSHELSLKRSELVDSLLKNSTGDPLSLVQQSARRYPLAIRDGLRMADDLPVLKRQSSELGQLADQMEHEILGGSVRIGDDGEMAFQPEGSDRLLGMQLSSSSVKSLSSLAFYIRHQAHADGFLIVDEPELNLHPDNQRRVARLLARLVNAGVRVIISTHSDYIIRELNNLIMLSGERAQSLREKHGYAVDDTLRPDQVGVYLFEATSARPLEVKPTGIEVATIDDEINALNRISQDIYYSLFDPDAPK